MGMHTLLSIIVVILTAFIVLKVWFPYPHFWINGGLEGVSIVLPVDFVLGPILTLVVSSSKKPKKELFRDLSLIALLQLFALVYGLNKLYSQRPLVEVLTFHGTLASPTYDEILEHSPDFNKSSLNKLSHLTPPLVILEDSRLINVEVEKWQKSISASKLLSPTSYITKASPLKSDSEVVFLPGQFHAEFYTRLYRALDSTKSLLDLAQYQQSANRRLSLDKQDLLAMDTFRSKHPDSEFFFFPLKAKYGSAIKVLDKNAKPVTYLNVKRYDK